MITLVINFKAFQSIKGQRCEATILMLIFKYTKKYTRLIFLKFLGISSIGEKPHNSAFIHSSYVVCCFDHPVFEFGICQQARITLAVPEFFWNCLILVLSFHEKCCVSSRNIRHTIILNTRQIGEFTTIHFYFSLEQFYTNIKNKKKVERFES